MQTDHATLQALVCTAEASNASGITDPYKLYKHIHPSNVGTCIGSGMGSVTSMAQMFKDQDKKQDKMILSKKHKLLVAKQCPMSDLIYFPFSSIQLQDGSIFSYCHQVALSKFQLEHGNFSFLFSIIPILVLFSMPPLFNLQKQHLTLFFQEKLK